MIYDQFNAIYFMLPLLICYIHGWIVTWIYWSTWKLHEIIDALISLITTVSWELQLSTCSEIICNFVKMHQGLWSHEYVWCKIVKHLITLSIYIISEARFFITTGSQNFGGFVLQFTACRGSDIPDDWLQVKETTEVSLLIVLTLLCYISDFNQTIFQQHVYFMCYFVPLELLN